MLKKKRAVLVLLILVLFGSLFFFFKSNIFHSTKIIRFIASHGPKEVVLKPLEAFKNEVEKESNNRLQVEIVFSKKSNSEHIDQIFESRSGLESNYYQMGQQYVSALASTNPDFSALEVPFLFSSHEHAFSIVDGRIGNELLDVLSKRSNLVGLAYTYSGGLRILSTRDKEVKSLKDFKNLKIAVGSRFNQAIFRLLGADTFLSLPKTEIESKLKSREIDGLISVYPRYVFSEEKALAPITNELFFNTQFTVIVANKHFYNSLTESEKIIVNTAVKNASAFERKIAIDIANDASKNPKNYNIKVSNLPNEEMKKLKSILVAHDWEKEFRIKKGLLDQIRHSEKRVDPSRSAQNQ